MRFNKELLRAEKLQPEPRNHGKPWTTCEENRLLLTFKSGYSLAVWAATAGRRLDAALAKLVKLGMGVRCEHLGISFNAEAIEIAKQWSAYAPIRYEVFGAPDACAGNLVNTAEEGVEVPYKEGLGSKLLRGADKGFQPAVKHKEKETMKTIKVEQVTRINGTDAETYTDENLLTLMSQMKAQKKALEEHGDNALAKAHLKRTEEGIEALDKYMTERAAKVK